MRLALAQTNPTVGDIGGNAARLARLMTDAAHAGAHVVCFPELAICGYPPKDLLLQEGFIAACVDACRGLARASMGITAIVGCPIPSGAFTGRRVRASRAGERRVANALLVLRDGKIIAAYEKRLLPTYDVFDEDRYFAAGDRACVVPVRVGRATVRVGLSICEDLWRGHDAGFAGRYAGRADPVADLVKAGARVILNPSASPFVVGKAARHRSILRGHAKTRGVFVAATNQVGGNDDLIFDGHAAVYDPSGRLIAAAPGFVEHTLLVDLPIGRSAGRMSRVADPVLKASDEELLFRALVLGVRDYCRKTGFASAIVGLSGGIDSALTACIAAAALGPASVLGVLMPGPYSSEGSVTDAADLARRIGMPHRTVPIRGPLNAAAATLNADFVSAGLPTLGARLPDLTEENLQSRLRGTVLMAISNRTGAIVLTTGNKSELAVGYCTLYGDMNGGLAVLSDVTKEQVYALSRFINREHARLGFASTPIPGNSIDKPPSAELRPDQKDQDSLPPYPVLDEIIERYVERRQSVAGIARATRGRAGFDAETVGRISRLIDRSEYKRKQAATGLKITGVAFGSGRRVPIAQGWGAR